LEDGLELSTLHLPGGGSPNSLLQQLIPLTEIHRFEEKIPSINDIFIQMVSDNQPQEELQHA
jgi:ABC-2 type transport system ATP-binding protein